MRENRILRARGDHFVGVTCENRKNLRAIRGREMGASGAHGHLSFARRAAVAQIFENFRAQSFHWIYGLKSFWLSTIVPDAPGAPSGGMVLPFNCSNTAVESPAVTSNC